MYKFVLYFGGSLTGFGKGLNVGSEKKSHLPTCHLFWDVSQSPNT